MRKMNPINMKALSVVKMSTLHFIRNVHYQERCTVLIVGGGTGGCTMASKFGNYLKNCKDKTVVLEPSDIHYYQPLFTLVGGGLAKFESSRKPMKSLLPRRVKWVQDSAKSFQPNSNIVITNSGLEINYKYMIVAMGLQLHWDKIPGLVDALKNPDAQVCSIYSPDTVTKVFGKIEKTQDGVGVFTFPNSPVKCPGAPQKIAYIAEDYWRKKNRRDNIEVVYNTALPVIFGVKKYADALWEVCDKRNIKVNLQTNLIEIRSDTKEAVFQSLTNPEQKIIQKYSFLHVCPPMGPPDALKQNIHLTNEAGFLNINSKTLQHVKYENIYGLGDCTSTPNSKTMAAVAAQSKILFWNLVEQMSGSRYSFTYDGYASCPLVTAPGKCILAEFDYKLQPLETFPVNQKNEYWAMYIMKKYLFPYIYWKFMLKGLWGGPEIIRKFFKIFKFNK